MEFASLGSGSSGNATLVRQGDTLLMVDCGFGLKETEARLTALGLSPEAISAILVTHEHSDHLKGVGPFCRKYSTPVYMTEGTFHCREHGKLPVLNLIEHYAPFDVGDITATPVAVPHDAREPAQYVFESHGVRLGVLTDLGKLTEHIYHHFAGCHGILVEANHDLAMLAKGPYPISLQRRVASDWGHLNNLQTLEFLKRVDKQNLQQLVVGHISQKNNSISIVESCLAPIALCVDKVLYATQEQGFGWLNLAGRR